MKKLKAWDLLVDGNNFFLCLGEQISFPEQYQSLTPVKAQLVSPWFLSLPLLGLLHRMVDMYYTTYKSVMRLFLPDDIQKLLERENKIKGTRDKGKGNQGQEKFALSHISSFICSEVWQTLLVFPDLWTMFNMTDEAFREDSSVAFLSAIQTQNQKDTHRREIKRWQKSVILCTSSEIFQDFHNLKKIIFIDPHKRYYASQQDPRYKVGDVLDHIKKIYEAEVEILWV